ncbi:hypothetical protein MYCTH_88099 [Thermothelomyces thermophilus ATCC 42464]|uniref:Uncharacterized protein n=1 Tax=Thermothelomyces thermophilus (strain ATCC 42464 / BCRC 31852 / DSM 1799) TaxID=573729 RepID=G2QD97_THET4|nr:uncharacterized protein MYCTH_88099 [Thermothelomyces thermophilus ATCC 42464]AEO57463.1 hypothetical protein MYCTH_88099 [Thermothelomyces thermophilus ATCC 42464]
MSAGSCMRLITPAVLADARRRDAPYHHHHHGGLCRSDVPVTARAARVFMSNSSGTLRVATVTEAIQTKGTPTGTHMALG